MAVAIPFLDEVIADGEDFVEAATLTRPTYTVAYLVVRAVDGTYRVTHRGTGQYDYFFDSLIAYDRWDADREVELLKHRFNMAGTRMSNHVRYYAVAEVGIEALQALR